MMSTEPGATAILIGVGAILLVLAVLSGPIVARRGVPVVLGFILLGMLAGSEGIGNIAFDDYELAFRIGTIALVLILFDGGLNTPTSVVKRAMWPAATLATAGVAITAGVVALAGRLVGLAWMEALLLGAVVSSTDAAAVFSVLRGSGIQLQERVAATVELESGLNDPMAVILTLGLTQAVLTGQPPSWTLLVEVVVQLGLGGAFGLAFGWLGLRILRLPQLSGGLYPILTLAVGALSFSAATLLYGSGFLAVYLTGLVIGNGVIPHRLGILRIHDFLGWGAQVVMFLALGLLAFPSQLIDVALPGLLVTAALILVARPLSIVACLPWFRYSKREVLFVSWVGLRGAVPIILAMVPMMAGLERGAFIFNIVFFVVVVSALIQGWSVRGVTYRLGLQRDVPPAPPASLEIASKHPLDDDILSFYIDPQARVCDQALAALAFPAGSSAMLIVRERELIAPRGQTILRAGDHLYVFCKPHERAQLHELLRTHRDHASDAS